MKRLYVLAVPLVLYHARVLPTNHSLHRNTTSNMTNYLYREEVARSEIVLKTLNMTNTTASPIKPYFGDFFKSFGDVYRPMHGYVSVVLCLSAMLFNTFNVVVLLR